MQRPAGYRRPSSPLKKSSWLRAALATHAGVAAARGISGDNAAPRLLGLGRDAALSPTEHFFNGLLAAPGPRGGRAGGIGIIPA